MNDAETRGYSLSMRIIHWVTAATMIFVIISGLLIGYDGSYFGFLYNWHRPLGFILLFLVLARIIAKLATPRPSPLPSSVKPAQVFVAHAVHWGLYAGLIIQPFLGWYATNAWGVKNIPFFFGWHLPQIAQKNRELGNYLLEIHHYLGLAIAALVVMHVGGALFHHFILKDGVLMRMVRT